MRAMENSLVNEELKFVNILFISLVKSPNYSLPDQEQFTQRIDKELEEYFKTTRKLKINDQFAIKTLDSVSKRIAYFFLLHKINKHTFLYSVRFCYQKRNKKN